MGVSLPLSIALICLVGWAGAEAAPAAVVERFVVVSSGEVVGALQVERRGDHIEVDYHVEENGRGPRTKEEIDLADGLPRRWLISGTAETGAVIRESFEWNGSRAHWRTLNDRGSVNIPRQDRALYLAQAASPYAYAVYVNALLSEPQHTLRAWPTGSVRADRVSGIPVSSEWLPPSTQVWALWGIDVAPVFVLLDGDGAFRALLSTGRLIIPAGWAGSRARFVKLAAAVEQSLLRDLTQKIVHRWDVPVYLHNVRVLDTRSGGLSPPQTVVTFRGRITGVLPNDSPLSADAVVFDGEGGTVMPALFDMHAHVSAWEAPLYLAAGITTVRDMGNDNEALLDLMAEFTSGRIAGPAVVPAGFLEGRSPFSAQGGFVVDRQSAALDAVRWYADRGYWQIKIYNSIEPRWVPAIASEAHRLGMRVAGHVPAFMSSRQAILAGYDEVTHLNQLLLSLLIDTAKEDTRTPFRFTALGERLAALDLNAEPFQSLVSLMQRHHTVLDPTVAILSRMLLGRPGRVTPAEAPWIDHLPGPVQRRRRAPMLNIPQGMDARYRASEAKLLEALRRLHEAGIPIVPGTDDAPGFMLQSELETWQRAGIAPAEVLRLATLGCASYLGLGQTLGSVERGKQADLILLASDPTGDVSNLRRIRLVMKAGAVVFPEEVYSAMQIVPFARKALQTVGVARSTSP